MLEQLKKIIKEYNLIEETKDSFWINFNNYRKEEKDEFEKCFSNYKDEKLNVWIHSISYKLKNWPECDCEYIIIRMDIDYDNKTVGKYEACYNMNGEYEDDYFIIYSNFAFK